jgi:hypothetical protein
MVRVGGVSCDTHNFTGDRRRLRRGARQVEMFHAELDFRMAYEEMQRVLGVSERTYC